MMTRGGEGEGGGGEGEGEGRDDTPVHEETSAKSAATMRTYQPADGNRISPGQLVIPMSPKR